jgi:hypothetical protein
MSLSFEPFRPSDGLEGQRALFKECFPETKGLPVETEAHYRWKMAGYPATPPVYEYTAADGDGLVGYYAALPYRYAVGEDVMTCGMVCDVMTAVRSRGQGVFTRLGKYALDEMTKAGIDFVLGYPIRPEVIPGHLKVGWEIAFRLPMYLMPVRSNALLATRKLGLFAPFVNVGLAGIGLALRAIAPRPGDLEARTIGLQQLFDEFDYEEFAARAAKHYRQALKKSPEFLRWRLSAPGAEYRAIVVAHGRRILGLSIARATQLQGVPSLAVLDLVLSENESGCLAGIAHQWRALARSEGCEVIAVMMGEPHAKRLGLWRFGFLRSPAVFSLIIKRLSARAQAAVDTDPTHWNLMWIDSDDL